MTNRMMQAVRRTANRPTWWQRLLLWYVLATLGLFLMGVRLSVSSVIGAVIFGAAWRWEGRLRYPKGKGEGKTYFTCSCGFSGAVSGEWETSAVMMDALFAMQHIHSGPDHNLTWSETP